MFEKLPWPHAIQHSLHQLPVLVYSQLSTPETIATVNMSQSQFSRWSGVFASGPALCQEDPLRIPRALTQGQNSVPDGSGSDYNNSSRSGMAGRIEHGVA